MSERGTGVSEGPPFPAGALLQLRCRVLCSPFSSVRPHGPRYQRTFVYWGQRSPGLLSRAARGSLCGRLHAECGREGAAGVPRKARPEERASRAPGPGGRPGQLLLSSKGLLFCFVLLSNLQNLLIQKGRYRKCTQCTFPCAEKDLWCPALAGHTVCNSEASLKGVFLFALFFL